jgi:hypothetical protein
MLIGCLHYYSPTKPGHCPYGHSFAAGMPQKILWMPCICAPAREAVVAALGERLPPGDGVQVISVNQGAVHIEQHGSQ